MLPYVGLDLAQVVAVGTLEPGLLAALIAKMTRQVLLPLEYALTIRIGTRNFGGPQRDVLPSLARIGGPARGYFVI